MTHLLKRYFSFFGKASRQQYGLRTLVFVISTFLLLLLVKAFSLDRWGFLFALVWFPVWMLALSATGVRRCREVGINPYWVCLWLFPIVGSVFYIVLGCLKPDDGVRITRPTPKTRQGLVHYLSVFGYATRQEYWCIAIPINLALNIAFNLAFRVLYFLLAFLLGFFFGEESVSGNNLSFAILSFSIAATYFFSISWISAAAIVRRCRDTALSLWWSSVLVIPVCLLPIAIILFVTLFQDKQQSVAEKIVVKMTISHNMTAVIVLLSVLFLAASVALGCLTSQELKNKELESKELANKEKA